MKVDHLSGVRLNDTRHNVSSVDSHSLGLLILSDDLELGFEVICVDDADTAEMQQYECMC